MTYIPLKYFLFAYGKMFQLFGIGNSDKWYGRDTSLNPYRVIETPVPEGCAHRKLMGFTG